MRSLGRESWTARAVLRESHHDAGTCKREDSLRRASTRAGIWNSQFLLGWIGCLRLVPPICGLLRVGN